LKKKDKEVELVLSPELPIILLARVMDSIRRCKIFSPQENLISNMCQIFKKGLEQYYSYVNDCLTNLNNSLPKTPTTEPNTEEVFGNISLINSHAIEIQKHYFSSIRPVTGGTKVDMELNNFKNSQLSILEESIVSIIDRTLSLSLAWIKNLLSKQKNSDFYPSNGFTYFNTSPVCNEICSFISKQYVVLKDNLDGLNTEMVLKTFGRRVIDQFLQHIKQFTISRDGSLQLFCDGESYRKSLIAFVPEKDFGLWKEIEKLYQVESKDIELIISSSYYLLDLPDLQDYVRNRADKPILGNIKIRNINFGNLFGRKDSKEKN